YVYAGARCTGHWQDHSTCRSGTLINSRTIRFDLALPFGQGIASDGARSFGSQVANAATGAESHRLAPFCRSLFLPEADIRYERVDCVTSTARHQLSTL